MYPKGITKGTYDYYLNAVAEFYNTLDGLEIYFDKTPTIQACFIGGLQLNSVTDFTFFIKLSILREMEYGGRL